MEGKVMVKKYAVVRWTLFTSISTKHTLACLSVFLITCILTLVTSTSITYLDKLTSLFDGYRLSGFNFPEFLRYIILRLTPIYLVACSLSTSIGQDSYFRVRLYKCSVWRKSLEYVALLIELLLMVLQFVVASLYYIVSNQSLCGVAGSCYSLMILFLPITTFLEIYMATLFFFNVFFLSKNSIFGFLLIFFLYLISSISNIPFYPFGLSTLGKIRYYSPDWASSLLSTIIVLFSMILALHLLLKVSIKKFLLR